MLIKKTIITLFLLIALFTMSSSVVYARVRVGGYYRSSGTYVMPHYRTSSNYIRSDNWSSSGNYNPYTGKKGYVQWWR